MNLKQIRYALAVAEELNFTRAAQRCHTVQSALSHQIAKLEEELGCTLFERTSRRVRLTPAGGLSWPAQRLLAAQQALVEEVTAADGAVSGTLTIGTISTINVMALTERLDKFHRHYPAVNIRLYVGMSEALLEDVRQQNAIWRSSASGRAMPICCRCRTGSWPMSRWWRWWRRSIRWPAASG